MQRLVVSVLCLLFLGYLPLEARDTGSNQEVVRRMIDAVNAHDFEALDAVVAADVKRHSAATPGVTVASLDEFKAFLRQDLAAVPDSLQEVHEVFGDGDLVAVRATYRGTQKGAMGPFPPSQRRVEIPFLGILRVADGRISEIWVEWDNLNALSQLGHFPPPPCDP